MEIESNFRYIVLAYRGFLLPDDTSSIENEHPSHGVHLAEATAFNHPSRFIEAVCYGHGHERGSYRRCTVYMYAGVSCGCLKHLAEYKFDIHHYQTFGRRKRKNADVVSRQHCGAAEKPRHWLPQRWWTRSWFCARVASFYIEEAVIRMHTKRMNAIGCELREAAQYYPEKLQSLQQKQEYGLPVQYDYDSTAE
ncbi:hypothetical protein T10_5303 [Trichinella papuae]|uniref:Uncharacterized protein n=1 Tax=Trichinella papuae TaxID=268474 RepID=A0A0V1MQW6_9BILA|nr:hypothetical protein T10_5303 [Trichinella papuae]